MLKKFSKSILLFITMMVVLLSGCGNGAESSGNAVNSKNIDSHLMIKAIDVGQGDAFLIQTGAQVILIDTGDDKYRDGAHKGETNNRLLAVLNDEGITHIDKLIMTHAHADHIGKAAAVLKNYNVDELIYNGIPSGSSHFRNALKAAKANNTKLVTVQENETLDFGKGVLFRVLSPSAELTEHDTKAIQAGEKVNVNNESIVGMLSFGEFSMLFTGDLEKEIEKELVGKYGTQLACKVYKTPHHGSHTSSLTKYVESVNPEWAVISCGLNNQYGHPHKETVNKFNKRGIKIMRTDLQGTITIISDGKTYSVEGEKTE